MAKTSCSICSSPQRQAIDMAVVSGTSLRDVVSQFPGVSRSSVARHKAHISKALTLAKETQQEAEIKTAVSLSSRIERLLSRLEKISEASTEKREWFAAIAASKELRECLTLLGKLSGELQTGSKTQIGIALGGGPGGKFSLKNLTDQQLRDICDEVLEEDWEEESATGLAPTLNGNFFKSDQGRRLDSMLLEGE